MHQEGLDSSVVKLLNIDSENIDLSKWEQINTLKKEADNKINIGILGKYNGLPDSYLSVVESLKHAALQNKVLLNIEWIDSDDFELKELDNLNGVVVPGGFGYRGIEGKVRGIGYLRENKIPFLGLCLGLQCAVIEFARNVCNIEDADSTEFSPNCSNPIIDLLPNQNLGSDDLGATMRLGTYPTKLVDNTVAKSIYKDEIIYERHRHRYEVNNKYSKLNIFTKIIHYYTKSTIHLLIFIIHVFINQYIDRDKAFDSILKNKLESFYKDLSWGSLPLNTHVNNFFSFYLDTFDSRLAERIHFHQSG